MRYKDKGEGKKFRLGKVEYKSNGRKRLGRYKHKTVGEEGEKKRKDSSSRWIESRWR